MTDSIKVKLRNKDGSEERVHRVALNNFYHNWWNDFGSEDLRRIYENFGMEVFRRSSCLDGFNAFIKRTGFKGRRCVEIGTCHGLTAIVLSRYFDQVVTFDIEPKPIKHELVKFLGIDNIVFHDVPNNDAKADIIKGLKFDAAYSDGDHTHDSKSDFDILKRCGRVLFHEYWPLQPQVWELVNALRHTDDIYAHNNYALWIARWPSS